MMERIGTGGWVGPALDFGLVGCSQVGFLFFFSSVSIISIFCFEVFVF
jgi:hypothetical protein